MNNDEYKVMGLASYGEPTYLEKIKKVANFSSTGAIELQMDYFAFHMGTERMYSNKFVDLFGVPRISEMDKIEAKHANIAASIQTFTEQALAGMATHACKLTGEENLCMAGGVALNGVANWHICQQSLVKNIFIQPAAGDGGCALGAALIASHQLFGTPRTNKKYCTLLGPEYSDKYIESFLKDVRADYAWLDDGELYAMVADLLFQNKIFGWFQGRMEFGPRALGNRSILANPCSRGMKDILNRRVKFREEFRPFAPAVIEEKAQDLFHIDF